MKASLVSGIFSELGMLSFYTPTMNNLNFNLLGILAFFLLMQTTSCNTSKMNNEDDLTQTKETKISRPAPIIPIVDRKQQTGPEGEMITARKTFAEYEQKVQKDPNDYNAKLNIVQLYMNEARITGNFDYYFGGSLAILDELLSNPKLSKDDKFHALFLKSTIFMSLHKFKEARDLGRQAVALYPQNAGIHGVLVDANVELGNYTQAVTMADKMVSIRPDLRSYSRVSYLREIHGDVDGAIQAMDMAVKAGYPGQEETSWSRVVLGQLYEGKGDLANAKMHYTIALQQRPDYAPALAGLGNVASKEENYKEATAYYEKAIAMLPNNAGYYENVASMYMAQKNEAKSAEFKEKAYKAFKGMSEAHSDKDHDHHDIDHEHQDGAEHAHSHDHGHNHPHSSEKLHSHEVGLEMGNYYLEYTTDYAAAFNNLNEEYERRPDNIDVNRTLAKAYYLNKDYEKAREHVTKAKSTGSKNTELMLLDGLLLIESGKKQEGQKLIKTSLETDPFQRGKLATEGRSAL